MYEKPKRNQLITTTVDFIHVSSDWERMENQILNLPFQMWHMQTLSINSSSQDVERGRCHHRGTPQMWGISMFWKSTSPECWEKRTQTKVVSHLPNCSKWGWVSRVDKQRDEWFKWNLQKLILLKSVGGGHRLGVISDLDDAEKDL